MDELMELRQAISEGRYTDALHIVDELDEMAKDDKVGKVLNFTEILLIHLIRQSAEQRVGRSWTNAIRHSTAQIRRVNKRKKSGGYHQSNGELLETLNEAFDLALPQAATEAFGGVFSDEEVLAKINKNVLIADAMRLIEH